MLRWIADRARSALSHRQPLAVLTFGKMRFLNTKIQETKETPWIRVFHFLGEPAATYHVGGNPAQMAAVYLGHHNPGQPQASARLGLKTIHCIVFCCAPASPRLQPRTLRVLPAQGPERGVSDRKRKRTPCGVLFLLGSGSYLSFRAVASQVLSAYKGLTSVFGMGTGGTP